MTFGPHRFKANGKWYLSASPSKKSIQRLKTEVRRLLVPSNIDPWDEVRDTLNRSLLGWSNGQTTSALERGVRPTGLSTSMSMSAYETSLPDGTRWQGAAHGGSLLKLSTENAACCVSNACPGLPCRMPRDETGRRAGCRKPARPVR
jgi:hypothetical protein